MWGNAAGVPFFVGCVAWNWSPAMAGSLGLALLKFLVMSGALLQARTRASWHLPLLAAPRMCQLAPAIPCCRRLDVPAGACCTPDARRAVRALPLSARCTGAVDRGLMLRADSSPSSPVVMQV